MDITDDMPGIIKTQKRDEDDDCGNSENVLNPKVLCSAQETEEPDVPEIGGQSAGACADFLFVDSMLNHLAKSQHAPFKSQQVGDPDLDFSEKKEIARDILKDNPARFLEKFGHYLLEDHLDYFSSAECASENYEVDFHVKQLRRFHSKSKNQVDVRNRRYEALKKLIEEGEYFSEEEMQKRNPLLYEQLIGQYLTPQEKEDKYKASRGRRSASYVVHLMGQIEDHYVNCLKKQQEDDEAEEMDTSDEEENGDGEGDDDDDDDEEECDAMVCSERRVNEDEEFDTSDESDAEGNECVKRTDGCQPKTRRKKVTDEEKDLLREEFVNNMYESFLEGRDADFDYTSVDTNPEYECLAVRTQDEEEQYFDSETPELVKSGNVTPADVGDDGDEEEEDELDKFMKNLNSQSNS